MFFTPRVWWWWCWCASIPETLRNTKMFSSSSSTMIINEEFQIKCEFLRFLLKCEGINQFNVLPSFLSEDLSQRMQVTRFLSHPGYHNDDVYPLNQPANKTCLAPNERETLSWVDSMPRSMNEDDAKRKRVGSYHKAEIFSSKLHTRKEKWQRKERELENKNAKKLTWCCLKWWWWCFSFTQRVTRSQGPELCSAIVAKDKRQFFV